MATRLGTHDLTHHGVLRLLVAAIVALVLVVTLSVTPAAAAEPPTPTEELLAGMVTEEVEPGVYRVINDGVRDLVIPNTGTPSTSLAIGLDDDIWVFEERIAYRLGEVAEYAWEDHVPWDYDFAPDGTLWGIFDSAIASFDGEAWTERAGLDARTAANSLAFAPDGTAWATATDASECPENSSGPDCSQTFLVRIDQNGLSTITGWQEVHTERLGWHTPVVSPDGDLWLVGVDDSPPSYSVDAFLRFDGTDWHRIDVPEGLGTADLGESFAFAPNGTLWAAVASPDADWHAPDADWYAPEKHGLARLDESGWTIFTEPDGVRPWGGQFWFATDYLRVAADGTVWVNAVVGGQVCDGVANFDGTTWTPYLSGHCIDDFDIVSDDGAWVLASEAHDESIHLYVITPEAVAATE